MFTIGERKVERTVETVGPGAYSPENADEITRERTTNIVMGTSSNREDLVSKTTTTVGPGQYEEINKFG